MMGTLVVKGLKNYFNFVKSQDLKIFLQFAEKGVPGNSILRQFEVTSLNV